MNGLMQLLRYARPQLLGMLALAGVTLATSLVRVLEPWPLKLLVDQVLGGAQLPRLVEMPLRLLGVAGSRECLLAAVAVASLMLYLAQSALQAALSWGWTVVGRRMAYALAEDLFARLQRRSLVYHGRTSIGEVITLVAGDSWSVYNLVSSVAFGSVLSAVTIAVMIVVMIRLDPFLTGIAVVSAPVVVACSMMAGRSIRATAELKRGTSALVRSHVQRTLTGIPAVQAFHQHDREMQRFRDYSEAAIRANQRNIMADALSGFWSGLAATVASAVLLWICALQVLSGQTSVGSILVFMSYFGWLQGDIRNIAGKLRVLQGASASMRRIDDVLSTTPEVTDAAHAYGLPSVSGRIGFEGVGFAYEDGRPVLNEVSFEIEPGQTVALVGPTGAGKSTLVSLIPRFFDPTAGRVLIDGHDLRDVQLASLRGQIGLVLQEPFLFPLTVAENIAYGRPNASFEEIEAAARAANAHEFVSRLAQGYDTVLGERGATLSGGERQRLSIARALLKDAPILILDEPTSALDAGTEALIIEAMRNAMRGRTTIIIAHRLATIRHADHVLVLDHGKLIEQGPHDALMRSAGLYSRYVALQTALPEPSCT